MKKISDKQKVRNKLKALETLDMQRWFGEIWKSTPAHQRKCFETGERLYGEALSIYFHHVLEKETWPEYRFERWNIVFVTWQVHDQAHKDLDYCPKIKEYREQLLKKINQ